MPLKRPRSPNNTPEKSSDKSAKVDVCIKCSESVVEDCHSISCDWCTQWEHRSCANISENALEALSRDHENLHFLQPLFGKSTKGLIIVSYLFQT